MFAAGIAAVSAVVGAIQADMLYGFKILSPGGEGGKFKFSRSEAMKDYIMIRRYEARRQIKQSHRIRVAAWVICTPIGICLLIKVFSLAIQLVLM